jgi:SAM-dependent methyltransferase
MNIDLINPYTDKPLTLSGLGLIESGDIVFPYKNGAYRVVDDKNYAESFGFQWNKFAETQIDRSANLDLSKKRFFSTTGWHNQDLSHKNILEVGSGAGRFTQIVLDQTKANLYSVDYSNAVEANYRNNGSNNRLKLFQASIYELPFAKEQFDKVFCFGVLQHIPDPEKAVESLIDMVKPGGELVIDFYPLRGWWTKLHAKYFLRPFTKRMSHEKLYNKIDQNIDRLILTYRFFSGIGLGKIVNRFLPVCDIDNTLPGNLPSEKLRELCLLDTFDMFSPEYDKPQKIKNVKSWFTRYGMEKVWGGYVKYENCDAAVVKGIKRTY